VKYFAHVNTRYVLYAGLVLLVGALLILIETASSKRYAPESVLVQVLDKGMPQEDAQCFGDVLSDQVNVKKKPLRSLASLYDFLDSASFFTNEDRGFYVFETGLTNYQSKFEIRIVCYTKDMSGVSYTVVNNENRSVCEIGNGGTSIVCKPQ